MSATIQGPKLPSGYTLYQLQTGSGRRYRSTNGTWLGVVRHTIVAATDDAYDHYYAVNGAKPILRQCFGGKGFVDVVSGHCITQAHVAIAGSYGGAFRYRAEEKRVQAQYAEFMPLRMLILAIADQLDEVAARMEVRNGGHD